MSDDQFEGREAKKFNELGGQIAGIVGGIIDADSNAKDRATARHIALLKQDNITADAEVDLIGSNEKLAVHYDLPYITMADTKAIEISTASVKTTMNVSATRESRTGVESNTETGAKVGGGFMGFTAEASFKASVGVSHEQRRKSDYQSTIDVDIQMQQSEPPEGLMKLLDSINNVVASATEINVARALEAPVTPTTTIEGNATRGNAT